MGQTLTHGVYLPDEGERNCYSGLAANWTILNGAVGTIAEHTSALSGKAPLVHTHTKSDITDFPAYGTTAGTICEGNDSRLSDARTPVAHTHTKSDVTDLLNSNFIPSANNSYDLGSSSYQWNNLYAKNYYYNGTAWGLDKANVWTEWQIQETTGINALIRLRRSDMKLGDNPPSSGYKELGGYTFTGSDNVNMSIISFRDLASGDTLLRFIARQKYDNNGNRSATGTMHESGIDIGIDSSRNKYCRPLVNNTTDLGTSDKKWQSLNGINPGALSFPDVNSWVSIDTTKWDKTGADNSYTPTVNGWILLRLNNVAGNYLFIANSAYSIYSNATGAGASWFDCFMPVQANVPLIIQVKGTSLIVARLIKCLGNV